ncbi:MAG: virB11 [Gammaproteobacteria bacterium]|jgi:type IV secretion system protein VirB11|nr:virB11 [Gammaproteobacteria bacterium]
MNIVLLENHLLPLKHLLEDPSVSEISINRPGQVWVERSGEMLQEAIPDLTFPHLRHLAKLVATYTEQTISEEHPLLSANLPKGYRIQIVYPPAVSDHTVGISIRKASLLNYDLSWYAQQGGFTPHDDRLKEGVVKEKLQKYHTEKNYQEFLTLAIAAKLNILISGGTSTGKTTFLNALLKKIPDTERIITIEDVPEIRVNQPNTLSLFASRNQQGRAKIDMQDLVEASLRLRPDRIIIGELRGAEAFSFLRAVNTGHPGSIATLHADTPRLAFEQLMLMVMQKNLGLSRDQIENYVHLIIHVVVQLKKGAQGARYVSEIYFKNHVPD